MKKLINTIDKIESNFASILLISTSLLVFIQVVCRYLFNYSISWSEEVLRLMIVWFIFTGSSLAVSEGSHVSMDIIDNMLNGKIKRVFTILTYIISAIFCFLIFYGSIGMISSAIKSNSMATSLPMPLYIPYLSVTVGMFLMIIKYIYKAIEQVKEMANNENLDDSNEVNN